MKCLKKKVFQDFQKLAGLWLVGEMDSHVGIHGSKVAEGFSAFQRRSCDSCSIPMFPVPNYVHIWWTRVYFLGHQGLSTSLTMPITSLNGHTYPDIPEVLVVTAFTDGICSITQTAPIYLIFVFITTIAAAQLYIKYSYENNKRASNGVMKNKIKMSVVSHEYKSKLYKSC